MTEESREEHAVRIARNQTLFRQVNENVKDLNEAFSDLVSAPEWVCECADTACVEQIGLTPAEYEALRAVPTHFAVAPRPSHVFFEVENVVGQTDRYWIVEKIGSAAALVTEDAQERDQGLS